LTMLAQKSFSIEDQARFAEVSGDHNPIHIDPVSSRRTQAGSPVVHGISLLLWALNSLAAARPNLPPLRGLRSQFKKMVYLHELVSLVAEDVDSDGVRLCLLNDGILKCEMILDFRVHPSVASSWATADLEERPLISEARELNLEEISRCSGLIPFRMSDEEATIEYPAAATWLGANFVRGLGASSYVVGMVCPGLNSLYSELSIIGCKASNLPEEAMVFRVKKTDARYGLVVEEVACSNFTGTVRAFLRAPPVRQATMQSLQGRVVRNEFEGSLVLIVGGSRGLGELTAKLIASGGGRVLITWQSGRDDATRVAGEIRAGGGYCETLHYDARQAAEAQLASMTEIPTHVYYFATPLISQSRSGVYGAKRFAEFVDVYVDGFWQLIQALRSRRPTISVFYPSTIFVSERPPGMSEYAMAKIAGELLCEDINAQLAPTRIIIKRLPRLPTDQTASLTLIKKDDPLEVMLPILREVQLTRLR
jgi:hypothetical protein